MVRMRRRVICMNLAEHQIPVIDQLVFCILYNPVRLVHTLHNFNYHPMQFVLAKIYIHLGTAWEASLLLVSLSN